MHVVLGTRRRESEWCFLSLGDTWNAGQPRISTRSSPFEFPPWSCPPCSPARSAPRSPSIHKNTQDFIHRLVAVHPPWPDTAARPRDSPDAAVGLHNEAWWECEMWQMWKRSARSCSVEVRLDIVYSQGLLSGWVSRSGTRGALDVPKPGDSGASHGLRDHKSERRLV